MSNGFGTINARNINEIVASLAKQIKDIKTDFAKDYTVLNNKLEKCEEVLQDLKDYIETVEDNIESEYHNLQTQIEKFDEEIAEIRAELSQVNYRKIGNETVAVGIAPLSEYSATSSTYPFSAKYAVNDSDGNNIVDTYAAKVELGNTSATLSADYTQKIAESSSEGMSALSSVSGQLTNAIDNESQARQSKDDELDGAIRNESTERIAKDNELEERIATEENTREEAISGLQNLLEQEVIDLTNVIESETARATSAEDALRNSLTQEIVDRANAITDLGNSLGEQIAEEENRATSAENDIIEYINDFADITEENIQTLENNISSVSSDLSLIINDNYYTLSANIEEEKNRASNEEYLLSSAISAEIDRATEAEQSLQENINNEISAREQADTTLQQNIDNEESARTQADNNLQTQIDTIEATQNVVDIVGTKVALDAYDTSKLKTNDKIQVLKDETQENATTIYNWNNGFSLVGTLGPYYTKSEVDTLTGNLNGLVIAEKNRATSAEGILDDKIDDTLVQLDAVSGILLDDIITSSTNLSNTITSLSSTVDDTFESLSGVVDTKFINTSSYINEVSGIFETKIENTNSYIDEVSGTAQTQFTNVNNEITNLYKTKQDLLSAGDGIDITNDVVSHSIKIIENNDQEDTIEDTIMSVYLKNNHYKVITLDPTVTEIHFWITETDSNVLQETGFEFQVPTNSVLTDLEFRVIDNENIKIYTIIPKTYKTPNIYQGTIVNYRCTIGEYKVE